MKKTGAVSKVFVVLFFGCAIWNFLVCLKAITLGQGKPSGNTAFYLMFVSLVAGASVRHAVYWLSKKLNLTPFFKEGRK